MASPSTSIAKANSTFNLALFKKLSEDDKTANIFYSPFSISSALAMVMLGARGSTAAQMSEVLGFMEGDQPKGPKEQPKRPEEQPKGPEEQPMEQNETQKKTPIATLCQSQMQTRQQLRMHIQQQSRLPAYLLQCLKPQTDDDDNIHAKFATLLKDTSKKSTSHVLHVANRLYGEQSQNFIENYLAETKKHYEAELESVDFKTKASEVRAIINSWVEEKTQGTIKEVLSEGVLDNSTRLVLINAIYFKGLWDQQFEEKFTEEAQFRVNKNDTKPVMMMWQKRKFSHRDIPEANIKVLEMPYKGKDLSMLLFLPNDIEDDTTGLEKLEEELTHQDFVDWTRPDMMIQGEVDVKLPRFKLGENYDLKKVLVEMGMSDAFDVSISDFSGMSPANDLFLSKVVHKASMAVNEEGTEAAAATAPVINNRSLEIPFTFHADHPFIFFIRHNKTKTILFAGRLCSPV